MSTNIYGENGLCEDGALPIPSKKKRGGLSLKKKIHREDREDRLAGEREGGGVEKREECPFFTRTYGQLGHIRGISRHRLCLQQHGI
mmetsp:Transcript_25130/g.39174  ORF Transcript_25130/g.39174 Transcript_25130/m.39174 type:complete len:87 (+) Transcript_25130:105-365(+)